MLAEFVIAWVVLVALLLIYSEYTHAAYVGIIAGVLLLIMGAWVLTDANGIEVRTGEIQNYNNTAASVAINATVINSTQSGNITTLYQYSTLVIPIYAGYTVEQLTGILALLFGLAMMLIYTLRFWGQHRSPNAAGGG